MAFHAGLWTEFIVSLVAILVASVVGYGLGRWDERRRDKARAAEARELRDALLEKVALIATRARGYVPGCETPHSPVKIEFPLAAWRDERQRFAQIGGNPKLRVELSDIFDEARAVESIAEDWRAAVDDFFRAPGAHSGRSAMSQRAEVLQQTVRGRLEAVADWAEEIVRRHLPDATGTA